MWKRLRFVCLTLAVLGMAQLGRAQFTDPRNYENTPVGINQLELAYSYAHSNASIDTSLLVAGAKLNLNEGMIDYTRYFGLLHHLAWIKGSFPVAGLGGSVEGTSLHSSISGGGDSNYEMAVLLKGGPALSADEFANYKPTTTVGVSLGVTAPTGQYDPNRVLNLGADRWAFKPEIGVSHPFGPEQKWVADVYGNAEFYTDNTSYHGTQILSQDPLPGLEGHISYSFRESLWASLDTRYSSRGDTFLNHVYQNDRQQNLTLGSELHLSLNSRNSLVFVFAKAVVHHNGPTLTGFTVRYDYSWGKGYR
jgi:hypothetical protein